MCSCVLGWPAAQAWESAHNRFLLSLINLQSLYETPGLPLPALIDFHLSDP